MTYRALLIGNSSFDSDAGLSPLNAPVKDVARLHHALVSPDTGMFEDADVRLVTEATCARILDELDMFFASARRDDLALLYYSGHGVLDERNQLYLCARDTRSDRLLRTAISNNRINEFIDQSPTRCTVILLDCCASGQFKAGAVEAQLAGSGKYVISSTRGAALANDSATPTGTSLFTEFVVEGLLGAARDSDGDGLIELRELYDFTRDRLRASSTQVPHCRFDGDGAIVIARIATAKDHADTGETGRRETFMLAETSITLRDVEVDERLREETIDVLYLGAIPAELSVDTPDDWIEAWISAGTLVLRFRPRVGINRGKVTVRDTNSATTATVRIAIHVLPPRTTARGTDEPWTAPPLTLSPQPAGSKAADPTPKTIPTAPSEPPPERGPTPSQPEPARSERGGRRRRVVILSVVGVAVVAAGTMVGAWLTHRATPACPIPMTARYSGSTRTYQAGGILAIGPAKWTQPSTRGEFQKVVSPRGDMWFWIGTRYDVSPQTTISDEEASQRHKVLHPSATTYHYEHADMRPDQHCQVLGTRAFQLDYTGIEPRSGLLRRQKALLWIHDQTVKQITVNAPANLWDKYQADAIFAELVGTVEYN